MKASSTVRSQHVACTGFLRLLSLAWLAVGLAVQPLPAAESAGAAAQPFIKEIDAFAAADKTNPPPAGAILFVGSSSIRMWKTLAADFPRHQVINRGFGGSQIIDSVNYASRIVLPYRPRQILMYAGGNDINGGKTPEQVRRDFEAFVTTVHAALPDTRIDYISIAPNPARWAQIEKVRTANRLIAEFIQTRPGGKLRFIDVHSHMLDEKGQPKAGIYLADRLHMNAEGYKIWTGIIAPLLEP